ncbi:MAG: tRNA uridine-5-carboxymethylaminomethyl(34) synthesis enzyme MnmG [Phycisphaerales bacterium]
MSGSSTTSTYQVIVIGGGHAGVEAGWAAANLLGTPTLRAGSIALVTLDPTKIGVMSCNPAIGGLAKGQLVREIDALAGLMGLATDATGIQFRVLNTSKGPAVHGPRAQCDKHAYARAVQAMLATRPEIDIIQGSVESLLVDRDRIQGVRIHTPTGDRILHSNAVVLTTGTFMRGLMHTGEYRTQGGRHGESAANAISASLTNFGFELGRLKTGTPPRLKRSTIRWEDLPAQHGDTTPTPFSDLSTTRCPDAPMPRCLLQSQLQVSTNTNAECRIPNADSFPSLHNFPVLSQLECRQTSTTSQAHDLIRVNLHRAPMFTGQIESTGPRYCPSIEDKVVRFSERDSHGVFLEPESHDDDWIYCNGISTSLPSDVQDAIVRSMPGCENAEILRHGYAVEYDMVRPHQILPTGMTRHVHGLFLAGQINGTSGYEEAAAQGLIAGINAARLIRNEPEFTLSRDQAYIGVLMDDLVTKTPVEPYRMFTSRAEHRLLLRADNAVDRLTPIAQTLGLLDHHDLGTLRREMFENRTRDIATLDAAIPTLSTPAGKVEYLLRTDRFEFEDFDAIIESSATLATTPRSTRLTVYANRRYEPYIRRQEVEIRRQAELEHRKIPESIDFESLPNLRTEARQSLARFRPRTFGQASRLEGITPADLTLLAVLCSRRPPLASI